MQCPRRALKVQLWHGWIPKLLEIEKGDCAWSCSRWQTQPEKICKLQRTNQCPLRTSYWFVPKLWIFSGCVYLEQLRAQSPFLFPIVFGINLIPFFDIGSVLAVLCSGMHSLLGPRRVRNCRCLWPWQPGVRVSLRPAMSNLSLSPNPLSNRGLGVLNDGRKYKIASIYNPTLSTKKPKRHWKIAQSCRSPTVSARLHYHGSNSVAFVHRAGALAKEYPLSKLFSKAELLPFEQEKYINLVCSSCSEHANQKLLGDPRQADQWPQSFNFSIVIHQSLDPAAQAPRSLS